MKSFKNLFMSEIINKETLAYMIWGGLTAFSTVVLYFILVNLTTLNVAYSNTIANVIGIILAYYANKKYVFNTDDKSKEESRTEIIKFFSSRIFVFILETILLVIMVMYLGYNKNYSKIFTSFVTVIINYFVAKIIVF